ncbi:hypothetical protein [Lewinella sp. W8]|uniref:hypothetical protein n=1 Tax=Lewinella sp. W8 TaxID=2528208 RepID=UPI0010681897|nr:hypothetical protein [Lewinella sp. W8]MTB53539.1 hypothetical protein [Lewinella sp. W8]
MKIHLTSNLILSLLLMGGLLNYTGCKKEEVPSCDTTDLNDVLSGETWEVSGSGEIITFNADGNLIDEDNFFTPETSDTETWNASGESFSVSYTESGGGSGSFSTIANEITCDRVELQDFTGVIILIRQ